MASAHDVPKCPLGEPIEKAAAQRAMAAHDATLRKLAK
jgi:hypothetical protein